MYSPRSFPIHVLFVGLGEYDTLLNGTLHFPGLPVGHSLTLPSELDPHVCLSPSTWDAPTSYWEWSTHGLIQCKSLDPLQPQWKIRRTVPPSTLNPVTNPRSSMILSKLSILSECTTTSVQSGLSFHVDTDVCSQFSWRDFLPTLCSGVTVLRSAACGVTDHPVRQRLRPRRSLSFVVLLDSTPYPVFPNQRGSSGHLLHRSRCVYRFFFTMSV